MAILTIVPHNAYGQLKQWLEIDYNQERIHSALNYATPAEHEADYWKRCGRTPSME
jgi:transposase InsO family protein